MVISAEAYTSKRERSRKGQREAEDLPPYLQDPVELAREFKMIETEFLEEQKRALKEHKEQKRKKDQQNEIKQALGESITAAEQRVLDEIKSQAETGRKQGSSDQSTLDVGHKDMRRQRSLWPHVYDTISGGAGNDSANIHRCPGNQRKSSSIAQAEGCGEMFQNENGAFHADHHGGGIGGHGGHADYGGKADHGSHGGYGGHRDHGGGPPYARDHERAQVHEYLHDQFQGGAPQQPQQLLLDEVHSKHGEQQSPNLQQSFLDVDRQHLLQSSDSANDREGAGESHDSQPKLVDEILSEHEHSPSQHQLAASPSSGQPDTTHNHLTEAARNSSTPSNSSAVHLTVGSRVQIPTQSPLEPFRYGVIRWIGRIPPMQGLVAGIEMVSAECVCISLYTIFTTGPRWCKKCARRLNLGV